MIRYILLAGVVVFFTLNMGASGIAPSFACVYGGGLIRRKNAIILFGLFVVLGAIILGRGVTVTLGKNLLPQDFLNFEAALIILASAAAGLFLANILKIPQSTSQVSVAAIAGAGLYFKHLSLKTLFLRIMPMWIILPLTSYLLTLLIYSRVYPPERDNLHIYQRLFSGGRKLKAAAIIVSCYVAFAIGSNNAANAAGPLFGAGIVRADLGLLLAASFFGIGAGLLGKGTLETAGSQIVPLGLFSSALVSFVTATLLIFASILGIPQSLVQLNLASVFAISCLKNGHRYTWDQRIIQRTFFVWLVTPIFSMAAAYLSLVLLRG